MSRYAPVWSEIARKQYDSLPPDQQRVVDAKVEQLLEDPTCDPQACYNQKSDQWSVPFGDGTRLLFIGNGDPAGVSEVVQDIATEIVTDRVGIPAIEIQQPLHAVGCQIPRLLGKCPGVLSLRPGEQPQ